MLRKAKYAGIALLVVVIAYEATFFALSVTAKHKAERLTELLATLKPGYTTKDRAIALFQANGVQPTVFRNACNTSRGPCDGLNVGASSSRSVILNRDLGLGFEFFPLPPLKRAAFWVNMYFINGVLDSINASYEVGPTRVDYSRSASDYQVRTSAWRYANGGRVASIGVGSSGAAFDIPFPHFALNYMYSVRCTDARMLWPKAPPPTEELHEGRGCS